MSKSAAASLSKILEGHGAQRSDNINVAMPCKVIAFDPVTLTASVQPLLKLTEAQPAQIMSVPMLGQRVDIGGVETVLRPILRAGDTVYVVCADAEIKNTLSGSVAAPDSGRRHNRMDAVIVGVMPCSL